MESSKPSKQRKEYYKMPMHRRQHTVHAHLSKDLHRQVGARALQIHVDDAVTVMRGGFKGRTGKVSHVDIDKRTVFIGGLNRKKESGTEIPVPIPTSNLLITALFEGDERRRGVRGKDFKRTKRAPKKEATAEVVDKKQASDKTQEKPTGGHTLAGTDKQEENKNKG